MHTSLLSSAPGLLRRPAGLAVALAALLSGCTDVLVTPASSPPAGLAVVFQSNPSSAGASGPGEAFDQADAVHLSITRSASGRPTHEVTLPFAGSGPTRRVGPVTLEMQEAREQVAVSLELRRGQDVLFRGSSQNVELRAGQTTQAPVAPVAVPGGVRVPDSVADLTSLGDTVQLSGSVTFATGDDIPGLPITWSTQNTDIVELTPQGRLIARAEGTAVVVATFQSFTRNLNVRVNPQVAMVTLDPASPQVSVGGTVQLSATLRDARGNVLANRTVQSWTSSNPGIASVNGNGLVQGVAQGSATITATSGTANGTASVTVAASVQPGTVTGRVVNALTGAAVSGASVNLGGGLTTTTNASGNFTISVPPGTRSATISAAGFASTTVANIVVTAGATTNIGTVGLSPNLPEGQTRIVLTWSPTRDLDSHLTGPLPNSQNRFRVYWASPGSLSASPFAFLDRDDVVGPGPETITIAQSFPGVYRYGVYDYDSGGAPSSFLAQSSNARVRVFRGQTQVADFTVPNQPGNFWTVFEMDGATGAITPINTMSNQGPGSIQSVSQGTSTWHADAATIAEAIGAQPKR